MDFQQGTIINNAFTGEMIDKISNICDSIEITNNADRADAIAKYLKKYKFKELGCGTNRIVFTSKDFEGVVFKIALDNRGIIDNNVEHKLSDSLSRLKIVTKNYENTGLISVAQEIETFTSFDMEEKRDKVYEILNNLKSYYILNDVGPKSFRNWGEDEEGNIMLLDYAYLVPMSEVVITECKKCGGELTYTDDLSGLRCTDCDKLYSFSEVTGGMYNPLDEMGFVTETVEDTNNNGMFDPEELDESDLAGMGFIND